MVKNGWHPEKSGATIKGQVVRNPQSLSHSPKLIAVEWPLGPQQRRRPEERTRRPPHRQPPRPLRLRTTPQAPRYRPRARTAPRLDTAESHCRAVKVPRPPGRKPSACAGWPEAACAGALLCRGAAGGRGEGAAAVSDEHDGGLNGRVCQAAREEGRCGWEGSAAISGFGAA